MTKRLKDKEIFKEDMATEEAKHGARVLLSESVRDLIVAMKSVELDELYTRDEIENFVLRRMEYYEKYLYSMDKDAFDRFLDDQLIQAIRRAGR